jgi:hypothetical protein
MRGRERDRLGFRPLFGWLGFRPLLPRRLSDDTKFWTEFGEEGKK